MSEAPVGPQFRSRAAVGAGLGLSWGALRDDLQLVTGLAKAALGDLAASSVTVKGALGYETASASGPAAESLDSAQYESDEGPCLDAIRQGGVVRQADFGPWPDFAARAASAGVHAVVSTALVVDEEAAGSLNLYFHGPNLDDQTLAAADLLVRQAEAMIGRAVAVAQLGQLNENLQEAISTREIIGEAKGILMEREGCTAEQAFDILRRASQRTNRKLRDLAVELVDSVEDRTRRR